MMQHTSRSNEPTADQLRELIGYDPATGIFTRLVSTSSNARAGTEAGTTRRDGYREVKIAGRPYLSHRLAWLHFYGVWPEGELDHINGDPSDNRIANLRPATRGENMQNLRGANRNNLSGMLGVTTDRRGWRANIKLGDRRVNLGTFDTPQEAHAAYRGAKRVLHPFGEL